MAAAAEDPGDMGCTRDAILDALENLTADEFKKFKMKLLSVPLREGFGRIPRGTLLPLDAVDLTDKLVSYYLEAYGAELTALVLRDMGMQEVAEQLQEAMSKGKRAPPHSPRSRPLSPHLHPPPSPNFCLSWRFHFLFLLPLHKSFSCEGGFLPWVLTLASGPRLQKDLETPLNIFLQALETCQLRSGPLSRRQPSQVRPSIPDLTYLGTSPAPPHHTPAQPKSVVKAKSIQGVQLGQFFPLTYSHSWGQVWLKRR